MKTFKWLTILLIIATLSFAGCSTKKENNTKKEKTTIKIGATTGPYSNMVKKAIIPGLEKKGYQVELIEFTDYVQPNHSLAKGELQANLFQHRIYLENFAKENKLDIDGLITVPTAPMGLYAKNYKALDKVKEGAVVSIPNDPTNAARAIKLLEKEGLITLKKEVDPLKASEKDITENPKKLKIEALEAAQLPRSKDSVDLAAVPGNFAIAAKMNLLDALALEDMSEDYRNIVAVRTEDKNSKLAKDIKSVIQSKDFEKIIDQDFAGFSKPKWMKE